MTKQYKLQTIAAVLALLATGVPGCAQKLANHSVPAVSVQDLGSSPAGGVHTGRQSGTDGIVSVTYAQLFKEGEAHVAPLDERQLRQLPLLPTGYRLFKGLAFYLQTAVVASGNNIVVFHVPSATSQQEFGKLRILHLEYDELSPTGTSWLDTTVIPDRWQGGYIPLIKKESYVKLSPDFPRRMISSIVDEFGTFIIASLEHTEAPPAGRPFTEVGVDVQVSPRAVRPGQEVTYTFTVSNRGDREAGYIGFIHPLDPNMELISFSSEGGTCKESTQSTGRVVCLFSGVRASGIVTITIKSKIRHNKLWDGQTRDNVDTATVVFKERVSDLQRFFVRKEVKTSIIQ
ncbi:MAG: hypothetical protein ACJ741_00435 [Pyrinomonadaceae bacterium]